MHLGVSFRHPDLRAILMVVRSVVEDKDHFLVPKSGFEKAGVRRRSSNCMNIVSVMAAW